ncbi:hypothetical protein B0J11DRAFT_323801 [Dendryphion nanum]|uniref:Uncharacterized protein n=1 Tax=Dendryphion nanum TaxID=256645 RepID=A0A9P9DQD9_9PLEO|nr:hypothetical protein B0J11DRAFT_323801 [Dendryphion nanum]
MVMACFPSACPLLFLPRRPPRGLPSACLLACWLPGPFPEALLTLALGGREAWHWRHHHPSGIVCIVAVGCHTILLFLLFLFLSPFPVLSMHRYDHGSHTPTNTFSLFSLFHTSTSTPTHLLAPLQRTSTDSVSSSGSAWGCSTGSGPATVSISAILQSNEPTRAAKHLTLTRTHSDTHSLPVFAVGPFCFGINAASCMREIPTTYAPSALLDSRTSPRSRSTSNGGARLLLAHTYIPRGHGC